MHYVKCALLIFVCIYRLKSAALCSAKSAINSDFQMFLIFLLIETINIKTLLKDDWSMLFGFLQCTRFFFSFLVTIL